MILKLYKNIPMNKLIIKRFFLLISILLYTTSYGQFLTQTGTSDLNTLPNDLAFFIPNTLNTPANFGTVLGLRFSEGAGGSDWRTQLAFSTENNFYYRQSTNNGGTAWTAWNKIYHSGNLNNNNIDLNANHIIAKELILNNNQTNILLSATGNSYIDSGNVGIGTTNPKNKLDVKGVIHSQEVKVDMEGWSDFVFTKDYKLPTLTEVENHINKNGHLENIPSEKDVLKNRINLGEMDSKLLQKIEELTLYVIDLNKKLDKQNQELDILKKKLQNK